MKCACENPDNPIVKDWIHTEEECYIPEKEITCNSCKQVYSLRAGYEPTEFCDSCAYLEIERLENACEKMNNEVCQVLGQALGWYPWYKDDQKNFPGATEKDG